MKVFRFTENFDWATMRFSTTVELRNFAEYFELTVTKQNSAIHDVHNNYQSIFKTLLISSFIIQLYSYLEYSLKEICIAYELKYSINKPIKGHHTLDKSLKYLGIQIGYDLLSNDYSVEIDFLKKLRNILVHHNGEFDEKSDILKLNYKLNKFGWGALENSEQSVSYYEISSLETEIFTDAYNAVSKMLMDVYNLIEINDLKFAH